MAFQFALFIPLLMPAVAADDAWVTYWHDGGCYSYVGQDESDARAKYNSSEVSRFSRILVNGGKVALKTGFEALVLTGCALDDGHLTYPNSTFSYNVAWELDNDPHNSKQQMKRTDDASNAGVQYQAEVAASRTVVMFDRSGSISKQNGAGNALLRVKGYYYSVNQPRAIGGNDSKNTTIVV